jgi:hypothetical protein
MKLAFGLLLILVGVALGLYAGLWWAFIGGIIQIIEAVKATPVPAMDVALGIARIVFAGLIGVVSAMALILPGAAMAASD